ncbi:Dabb family protein [Shimia ponticola]|uniref:Dabb family protein n=1 Tax=Shimia ponticola TaxID=2582893 RepID=UPI0011BF473D|nr:Dabb family protein [Shimia ponticola]
MILHCVFVNFRPDGDPDEQQAVLRGLGDLQPNIDGFEAYHFGPNLDFERKTKDHRDGFICTFRDRAALQAYSDNTAHKALGARLVAQCVGGADGILVYDLEV